MRKLDNKEDISLKPHQVAPIKFIKDNFGLIVFHSTGSGKTITSLVATTQFPKIKTIIICQKASKKAFNDEIERLGLDKLNYRMYTYQKIKKIMFGDIDIFKDHFVIVDEAHHLRSPTKDNMFLLSLLKYSFRLLLLTATPIINYLNDLSPLVNVVRRRDVLPEERELFNHFYFDETELEIKNEDMLKDKLKDTVSYYKMVDDINYPKFEVLEKRVFMSKPQFERYVRYIKNIIYDIDAPHIPIDILGFDYDTLNFRKRNSFLSATRQLSNIYLSSKHKSMEGITKEKYSPKIIKIVDEIQKHSYPGIVYSNFLENGIYTVARLLDQRNISFKMIKGSTSDARINSFVNEYNQNKFNILLLSSAGSESLDLKNTRQIHIVEPHWNEAKIRQVMGRAIRYKSHNDLPVKERDVKIFRWISIFPEPYLNMSADEYLVRLSKEKDQIFEKFKDIIIESSIEKTDTSIISTMKLDKIPVGSKTYNVNEFGFNKYQRTYQKIRYQYLKTKKHFYG